MKLNPSHAPAQGVNERLLIACKALLLKECKQVDFDDFVKQFGFSQEHATNNALEAIAAVRVGT